MNVDNPTPSETALMAARAHLTAAIGDEPPDNAALAYPGDAPAWFDHLATADHARMAAHLIAFASGPCGAAADLGHKKHWNDDRLGDGLPETIIARLRAGEKACAYEVAEAMGLISPATLSECLKIEQLLRSAGCMIVPNVDGGAGSHIPGLRLWKAPQ